MEYRGFFIEEKMGNNEFSYEKRKNKKIYVPPLIEIKNKNEIETCLIESENIAFSEYDDEKEINIRGIENFLKIEKEGQKIYIFDNHNHAFYFIAKNFSGEKKIMYHFDQHKDTSEPKIYFDEAKNIIEKRYDTKDKDDMYFYYTNYFLNVGNFIKPLKDAGLIEDYKIIDSSYRLDEADREIESLKRGFILDIDLDFFSRDMDYIENDIKVNVIKKYLEKADIVTICTSPYFIEFDRAKKYLLKIFEN